MKRKALAALLLTAAAIMIGPLSLHAKNADEEYRHALDLFDRGKLDRAEAKLREILVEEPDYEKAKVLLGLTLVKLSEQSEKQADRAQAMSELREAVNLDPSEAYWHSALAKLLHGAGNEDDARKECGQAAVLSPEDSILTEGCGLGAKPQMVADSSIQNVTPHDKHMDPRAIVSAPVPLDKPEPSFTAKAEWAHVQGNAVLWMVVNAEGDVEKTAVIKPLGLGLDQQALHKVLSWKFRPAMKDGVPVRVGVMVEVSFKLY